MIMVLRFREIGLLLLLSGACLTAEVSPAALKYYIDGMAFEFEGDYDRALGSYLIAETYAPDNPEILLTLAELSLAYNEPEQALSWFTRLVNIDDQNVHYRLGAAESAIEARQIQIAFENLQWLVENKKADYETRFHYATTLLALGREREAIKELGRIAKDFPQSPDPHGLLGSIHLTNNNNKKAIEAFSRAIEIDSSYSRGYSGLIAALEAEGRIAESQSYQLRYLELNPFDLEAHRRLIGSFIDTGDFASAYEIASSYIRKMPEDWPIVRQTAFLAFTVGDYEEAVRHFRDYLVTAPDDRDAITFFGRALFECGMPHESIAQYKLALDIQRDPALFIDLALALSEADSADRALDILEIARTEFPENLAVVFYEGVIFSRSREYKMAIGSYSEVVTREPGNLQALFGLGDALERLGLRDSAISVFRTIVKKAPEDPLSANYLGYLLVEENRELALAEKLISLAISKDPLNPSYIDSYGWLLYRKGRFQQALEKLLLAEELAEPEDPVILEHIGIVLEETGDSLRAIEYYIRAIEIDPQLEKSRKRLEELQNGQ